MTDTGTRWQEIKVSGDDLVRTVRTIVHEGNVRRVIIKNDDGRTLIEVPFALGVVGVLLAPVWAAIGALAALATGFTIAIERQTVETADDPADEPREPVGAPH